MKIYVALVVARLRGLGMAKSVVALVLAVGVALLGNGVRAAQLVHLEAWAARRGISSSIRGLLHDGVGLSTSAIMIAGLSSVILSFGRAAPRRADLSRPRAVGPPALHLWLSVGACALAFSASWMKPQERVAFMRNAGPKVDACVSASRMLTAECSPAPLSGSGRCGLGNRTDPGSR
ncbi:MAG: hypothetical protein HY791_32455 [Deltaproteobacteria bacterium]|nr:hypothetical protein [Deltaproteobacteria bacterium]